MNFSFLALLALVAGISAEQTHPREYYEQMFYEHMQKFQLNFKDGKEFAHRLQIFANNIDGIESHNADKTQTYTLGANKFTHLTFDEFVEAVHLKTRPSQLRSGAKYTFHGPSDTSSNPTSVDWTGAGKVGTVKDQGSCGSCWSFSAVGALESAVAIAGGPVYDLAEQELVSCDNVDAGCGGGWMDDAFTWIQNNGGITDETSYPYTSGSSGANGNCQSGKTNVAGTQVTSFTDVQINSVSALEAAVVQQPVSIAIQANQLAFQSYSGGVLTGRCGTRLDHGVLVTGYGTDSATNLNYWNVKNSWGTSWGENGYIRILRDDSNLCGVLSAPSFPSV